MKRLFVEIDENQESAIETCALRCSFLANSDLKDKFFDTIIQNALFHAEEIWEAIKEHDEIYLDSALLPRYGFGSSAGSGMLFNAMMHKAAEENLEGKKVFILREYNKIMWEELRWQLVQHVFLTDNELFVLNEEETEWMSVDIKKLIEEIK